MVTLWVRGGGGGGVCCVKQKTAYEKRRSLVGSEMCIRDRLYSEEIPIGYSLVKANTTGIDTKVNLETLFNAVLMHKEWFKEHFNTTIL